MPGKSMSVNAVLNAVRAGMAVVFPLITYPYALRTLGAESIGKVSFGNSIISYFSLLAALGVSTYAVREGTKRKNDRKEFGRFSGEILAINLISMAVSYLLLAAYLGMADALRPYRLLIVLQSVSIFLTTVSMDWINVVYEDYSMMTVRSIVTYVITAVFLFASIHRPEDYYRYAFLIVLSNGIVCVTNLYYVRRYASITPRWNSHILSHLKLMLLFFANSAAIAVYVNIDMTMIGFMKGDASTGVYAAAVRVYTVIKDIFIALYAVALPRLVSCAAKDTKEEYCKTYTDVLCAIMLLLIPTGVGVAMVSDEIMYILGGKEFVEAGSSLRILSFSLVVAIFGGMITALHNVATKREKVNLMATIYSALLNLILNIYFISRFNYNGAAFTTLLSEAFVVLYCLGKEKDYKNYIDKRMLWTELCYALIASLLFAGYIVWLKTFRIAPLLTVIAAATGSSVIYGLFLWCINDRYAMMLFRRWLHGKS